MRRVAPKGVILGGLVDVVATNVAVIPIVMIAASRLDVSGLPKAERTRALMHAVHATPTLFAAQVTVGLACSILGGYVAARIARHDELLNGALSAWLSIGFSVYAIVMKTQSMSSVEHVMSMVLSLLCGALGGYWAIRKRPHVG